MNTHPCVVPGLPRSFLRSPVKILSLLALLAIPWSGTLLAADPPALIPFQGHLARPTTADPNKFEPVPSGQYDILFTLYAAPVGGESKVWGPERHTKVIVVNGVVNAMLGSVVGFGNAIAANPNFLGRPLYVGITIDADGNPNTPDLELVPRQVFLPAVHALNATKLTGADWRTFFDGTDDKGTFTPGTTKAKNATIADRALNADRALIANTVNNGAINTAQLAPLAVTGANIADNTIPVSKLTGAGANFWDGNGTDIYRAVGNVGIGTASPAFRLHVQDPGAETGRIHVGGRGANGSAKFISFGDGNLVYVGENGQDDTMELRASRFHFNAGNVGIGITNPAVKLQVVGDIKLGPTGQYQAPAAEERLRIVRGRGTANTTKGVVNQPLSGVGSGFTYKAISQGVVEVYFNTPFTAPPAVTANAVSEGSIFCQVAGLNRTGNPSAGGFTVIMWDTGGNGRDWPFNFIAIGPR